MSMPNPAMNELELIEEEARTIPREELDESLAVTLSRRHGNRIAVEFPSPVNDWCYTLRSTGYVGHIPVEEDVWVKIRPKVPVENIFRMLEYAYNLKSFKLFDGATAVKAVDDLFDRLASILAKRVLDRARRGLYSGYIEHKELLPYLRGRIQLAQSLRAVMRGSTRLACEYEEHTPNLDDNRILAWTLYQLPRFRLQRSDVRLQVRRAFRALAGSVDVVPKDADDCIGRFYHRLNEDYQPMHGLCRFFLEHAGPGIDAGEHGFIPFVLYMPSLFESFVAEWLKVHLPNSLRLEPQYHAKLDESGSFEFQIDLVLTDIHSDRVIAVLDTKYKRGATPSQDDIQQIVAYATSMRTRNAFLVYPSTMTSAIDIRAGDVRVRSLTFDIGTEPDVAGASFLSELKVMLGY